MVDGRNTKDDTLAELVVVGSIKYLEAEGLLYVGTTPTSLLPVPLLPTTGAGVRLLVA